MSAHRCPAPGCDKAVPAERLACPHHWYSIAKPLRDALWRAYNDQGPGSAAHSAAVEACIRALGGAAATAGADDELGRRDAARAAELRRIADELEGLPEPLSMDRIIVGLRDRAAWWDRQAARR